MSQSTALQPTSDFTLNPTTSPTQTRLGGRITRYNSIFSLDNTILFVCWYNCIKLYSISTNELIGILSGHKYDITSLHCNTQNKHELYSTSSDGTIRLWNYITTQCIAVYDINIPILHSVLIHSTFYLNVNAKLYDKSNTDNMSRKVRACQLYTLNINKAQQTHTSQPQHSNNKQSNGSTNTTDQTLHITATAPALRYRYNTHQCRSIGVHSSGQYIASISQSTLTVYNIKTQHTIKYKHVRDLTTVKFHSGDDYIITGDHEGQILFWYGYIQQFDSIMKSNQSNHHTVELDGRSCHVKSYHWHSHQVYCSEFSNDGAYMLSGGEEGVLVTWQLRTGHKHFIPRLGSSICHIQCSHDSNIYALLMSDNSILFVNAITSQIQSRINGLIHSKGLMYQPSLVPGIDKIYNSQHQQSNIIIEDVNTLYTGLQWYRADRQWLMLNGLIGNIQLYDIQYDKSINIIQVTQPHNVISRVEDKQNIITRVEHVTCNPTADRLCTVEHRIDLNDQLITGTTCMKFWSWNTNLNNTIDSNGEWILNTTILLPHQQYDILQCKYSTQNTVVTIGSDNQFKLWCEKPSDDITSVNQLKHNTTQHNDSPSIHQSTYYTCVSTGYYRNYTIHSAEWSNDGSLLAVSYGHIITLWSYNNQTYQLRLQHTLVHPVITQPIINIKFSSQQPYIVCYTKQTLYVWNLLTVQCVRSNDMVVSSIGVADTSDIFALVTIQPSKQSFISTLQLYNFTSDQPIQSYELNSVRVSYDKHTQLYTSNILFIPQQHTHDILSLLYINRSRDIIRIDNVLAGGELQQINEISFSALHTNNDTVQLQNVPAKLRSGISAVEQHTTTNQSFIQRLYGNTVQPDIPVDNYIHNNVSLTKVQQYIDQISNTSSYLLPPSTSMFDSIISMVNNNSNNNTIHTSNNTSTDMVDMNIDHSDDATVINSSTDTMTPDIKPINTPSTEPINSLNDKLVSINPFACIDFTSLLIQHNESTVLPMTSTKQHTTTGINKHATVDVANDESQQNKQLQLNGIHQPVSDDNSNTISKKLKQKLSGTASKRSRRTTRS